MAKLREVNTHTCHSEICIARLELKDISNSWPEKATSQAIESSPQRPESKMFNKTRDATESLGTKKESQKPHFLDQYLTSISHAKRIIVGRAAAGLCGDPELADDASDTKYECYTVVSGL